MIGTFAIILTAVTILKYQHSTLEKNIDKAINFNNKLKNDLSFVKSEWEYLTSPKNIEKLSDAYLDYEYTSLVSFTEFLEILKSKDTK